MSVQNTQVEIARAKLIAGLVILAAMATSCAAPMIEETKVARIPVEFVSVSAATEQGA